MKWVERSRYRKSSEVLEVGGDWCEGAGGDGVWFFGCIFGGIRLNGVRTDGGGEAEGEEEGGGMEMMMRIGVGKPAESEKERDPVREGCSVWFSSCYFRSCRCCGGTMKGWRWKKWRGNGKRRGRR